VKVDVIVTSHTKPQYQQMLIDCISTLRRSEEDHKFNIVVVESTKQVFDAGQDSTVIFDKDEYNVNRAMKLGIATCSNDWVVLASNDIIWGKGWFTEILKASVQRPDILSWGAWSNVWNWHPNMFPNPAPIIEGYGIGRELSGWCIATSREKVLNKIDLHEKLSFWYSDNVYVDELRKHGIKHALVRDAVVNHLVSQTMRPTNDEKNTALKEYKNSKGDAS